MTVKELYPAGKVERKLPLNYDTMYAGKESFIKTEEHFDAIRLKKETGAFVSPYGVIFNRFKVIRESVYGMFRPSSYTKTFWKKRLLGKVDRISDSCMVAHNAYYQNYYHFLLEIMPRIYLAQKETATPVLLMHEHQNRFVKEYLSLFDFKSVYPMRDDRIVRVQEVYYTTQIARPLAYHPDLLKEFAEWIRIQLLDDHASVPSPRRIFISREKATYRISRNEADIRSYLEENGFTTINPEDYSVREQANLFKRAEIIIGSHGAGLSNFIFSDVCTLIVDIIHREHHQDCFYNAAAVFNVDYYYFQCIGAGVHPYKNNDDVEIDVLLFKNEIGPLIK